ncbi:Replication protein P [Serratia marcescens]|nr:DNA replication protein [Serratia marcescens]CUZ34892.1 Replication protein P [Serratia marcescens]CVA46834.1 Replication protein P [Serratia marcescens]CVA80217.1 Replication protein P [Serratia marcescens]CVB32680.1 Replication protein P [Serratia marcescens]
MMPAEPQARVVNGNAEKLVDLLFTNLMQVFPAAKQTALSTPAEVAAAKRQWILAFAENGITSVEQLQAGMRMARQQESDFWPSCGKFIGWCKTGAALNAGLPSVDEVEAEFKRYSANRGHVRPEDFNWSAPVMYWIVIDVRHQMLQYNHTESEIRKSIQQHLNRWAKRLAKGERVPTPAPQIAYKQQIPALSELMDKDGKFQRKGEELLARIRAKKQGQPT